MIKLILSAGMIAAFISGCGRTESDSVDSNSSTLGTAEVNLTNLQTIAFAPPIDAACLNRFHSAHDLRLSEKDVYDKGYEDIQICRYPFSNQLSEKVTSADFVTTYSASDTGLFVERNGYVHHHSKVPSGSDQMISEPVSSSKHSWDPEAPFYLASNQSGLVALTIGYDVTFFKREPSSNGNAFLWRPFNSGYSPLDRDKIKMAGTGIYTHNKNKNKIKWSLINRRETVELQCPSFCDDITPAVDGIYALSKMGIYFFDENGGRSTIIDPSAAPWDSVYSFHGSAWGVYVYYSRPDHKYVLSFITRDSKEIIIVEGGRDLGSVIANDYGVFVRGDRLGPWQYYELHKN